jgi:hypothetical protein
MKPERNEPRRKKADPVLPDQGGRSMPIDPPAIYKAREETVRQRAYERYEQRGKQEGRAVDDWLAAESEIVGCSDPGHQ